MDKGTLKFSSRRGKLVYTQKILTLTVVFLLAFFLKNQQINAQTIPGTGTSAGICANCTPIGWGDADPLIDGTPEISNRDQAGGPSTVTIGNSATWLNGPLPLPPSGDVRWISLRDIGTEINGQPEENVTTTMTGLIIGRIYKLTISSMSVLSNQDGSSSSYYSGTYIDQFDFQTGSDPRRTITAITQEVWANNTIIFVASSTTQTFSIYPGGNGGWAPGNSSALLESVHISVDSVDALEILDTDGDGIDDAVDIDDDNDGILDTVESGGNDPNGDEDGDGIVNYQDVNDDGTGDGSTTDYTDANSDGYPDAYDFDGDGIPNHLDLDADNDGILDNIEAQTDAGFTAFVATDSDMDGLVDVYDTTPNGTSAGEGSIGITPNAFDSGNANDDTTPDYLDIDTDDDGIPDNVEAQTTLGYTAPTGNVGINGVDSSYENVDTYSLIGITVTNTDITDLPDYRDNDSDNDGITDLNENGEGNILSGSDLDGDGLDNNFDQDNVNYDINDNINTPSTDLPDADTDVNTGGDVDYRDGVTGLDTDDDGIPDIVDLDDDNDGITDARELCNTAPGTTANSTISVEINFDEWSEDITWNLRDPSNNIILTENYAGTAINVDPTLPNEVTVTVVGDYTLEVIDAFGDGFTVADAVDGISFFRVLIDGIEVYNTTSAFGNNPAFGDGFTSTPFTVSADSIPCFNGDPSADDDSDGTPNYEDPDYVTGIGGDTLNANGTWTSLDHDADGIPDHLDLDSDNDGITDNTEAQTTAGYIGLAGTDEDNDGIDDAYDSDCTPCATNGTEIVPTNTDGALTNSDSSPDYKDIDADNDGIPDNVEAQTTTGYSAPNGVPGENGLDSAYDFTDSFSSTGLSSTLIDTDGDVGSGGDYDYRETDSDGDGTLDVNESGITANAGTFGTDTDNDGLDDLYEGASTNDIDPNDEINTPSTNLLDADGDVNVGGDVDYRDSLAGIDTDGDGIINSVDIDDDNDGILDTTEDNCATVSEAPSGAVVDSGGGNGVPAGTLTLINDGDLGGNNGIPLNRVGEYIVVDLGGVIPTGVIIQLHLWKNNNDGKTLRIAQLPNSTVDLGGGTNPVTINDTDITGVTLSNYTLTQATQYLQIEMTARSNGRLEIIEATVSEHTSCSASDFDGDGIVNSLDLDSDGDGILDITESQLSGNSAISLSGNDTDMDGLDDAFDDTVSSGPTGSNGTESPLNSDTDGNLDYLDIDSDDDGIPDNVELQTTQGYTAPTGNVGLNGIDEAYENNDTFTATGLTPNDFSGTDQPDYRSTNSDSDAFLDADESGITLNPGSLGTDSDGDGLDDIYEGSDATPGEAYDVNDEINDPVNDLLDVDNDAGTTGDVDYRDSSTDLDSDGDGIPDVSDVDDDNDGILDTIEDAAPDGDADGIPNSLDIDSDNDGIPDNIEAQSTTGYIAPSGSGAGFSDLDRDGLDDVYDPSCSFCPVNGTAITPVNTDNITGNNSDAIPDYLDTDSDGDGINDILENGNANTASGIDTDGDGLDDAFEGIVNDIDVNDDIDNPLTDLPDIDSDASTTGSNTPAADYNDVDYRDIDDDRPNPMITGNTLWLRADIGTTGGSNVSLWEDQTTSNADFTGAGGTQPDATAVELNFNPTVTFTPANNDVLTFTGNLNPRTMYIVYNDTSTTSFTSAFTNNDGNGIGHGNTDDTAVFDVANTPADVINGTQFVNGLATTLTTSPRPDSFELQSRIFLSNLSNASHTYYVGRDRTNTTRVINGSVAEVILFDIAHTAAQKQQIESYLAIKYGFTLDITDNDGTITEGDYILQDLSTIVWNESENSTYHNDVAGIGRDDGMLLMQKQSRSVNSDAIITIGLREVATNNASNGNSINTNKSFLMWGNNNANLVNTSARTLLCESENQMDRIWKIVETGNIGTVEVAAVQSTVDAALNESNIILFKVADDSDFTVNVKHIPVTPRTVNGVASYVVDFDFNGTKYFTYSDTLGIFWNGDANAWTGGAGTAGAPTIDPSADGTKVLVIDAETTLRNAVMIASANVECVWVKPNSKLVINNDLFLEFDQDFLLEGEIRLIGDAQLVQSHTGLSNVQGSGVIYRDQASLTPSQFRYNYWSSPVVANLGDTNYTVADIMHDGTAPTRENSLIKEINFQNYNSSDPTTLNSTPTDPITIATWWIYAYYNGVDRNDWQQRLSTGAINVAEGYIMKSTGRAPQNFTFMGSPNDGTYTKVLTPATTSLLGNPYPSVIDTQQFISDNSNTIDGTLYFWEHQGESSTTTIIEGHDRFGYIGGYSQRNEAMGVAANSVVDGTAGLGEGIYMTPPEFIAVGQGFFVTAPANKGGVLTFQNSQRAASTNNVFFRPAETIEEYPNLKIGMDYVNDSNTDIHRQLGVNFKPGNTFEYESGFDSQIFDLQPTDMFWDFDQIESNLIIAGVGEINTDLQVPLGFVIDSDSPITIMLDELTDLEGYTVYLGDLMTGRLYNLEDPIELNLPKGTYTNRFVILFGGTALSTDDNPLFQGFNLFRNNTTDQIIIRNNNGSVIKKVEVFNILGQQIKTWKTFSNTTEERLSFNAPSAMYIVKVTTDKGEITKKIIVD